MGVDLDGLVHVGRCHASHAISSLGPWNLVLKFNSDTWISYTQIPFSMLGEKQPNKKESSKWSIIISQGWYWRKISEELAKLWWEALVYTCICSKSEFHWLRLAVKCHDWWNMELFCKSHFKELCVWSKWVAILQVQYQRYRSCIRLTHQAL